MSKPESSMRQKVIESLVQLHAVAIEDTCNPGTPDVNFSGGWMELKWIEAWPARPATPVRLDHFTPAQREWLKTRHHHNEPTWLLLKVGKGAKADWLLFNGFVAAENLGRPHGTKELLTKVAKQAWWGRCFTPQELIALLAY